MKSLLTVAALLALTASSGFCRLKDYPSATVFGVYSGTRAGWTTVAGEKGGAPKRERTVEAVSFRIDKDTFTGTGFFSPNVHEKAYTYFGRLISSSPTRTGGVLRFTATIPNPKTKVPEGRVFVITINFKRDSRESPTYRLVVDYLEYTQGGPFYSHYRTTAWQRK